MHFNKHAREFVLALYGVLVLVAAAIAHEAIDLAGDVLLAHDTYDGLPHDSRVVLAVAAIAALFCFVFGYALRVADRRGGFDLAAAARHVQSHALAFGCALCTGTLVLVPLMEWIDASSAGARIDGIADVYGGSVLLGAAGCVLVALALLRAVVVAARWLCAHEHRVCRLITRLLRASTSSSNALAAIDAPSALTAIFLRSPLARKRALRAPPAILA